MSVTSNNSGVPLYHYSKRLIEEERKAAIKNTKVPMNRKRRRLLERKLRKKGIIIE